MKSKNEASYIIKLIILFFCFCGLLTVRAMYQDYLQNNNKAYLLVQKYSYCRNQAMDDINKLNECNKKFGVDLN